MRLNNGSIKAVTTPTAGTTPTAAPLNAPTVPTRSFTGDSNRSSILALLQRIKEKTSISDKEYTLEFKLDDGNYIIRYQLEQPYSVRSLKIAREIYDKFGIDVLSIDGQDTSSFYGDYLIAMVSLTLSFITRMVIETPMGSAESSAFNSLEEILNFIDAAGLPFVQKLSSDISDRIKSYTETQSDFFGD